MNIAFLNIYSGLVNRGAETFVHELATRLGKHHQATVFQGGSWRRGDSSSRPYRITHIPHISLLTTSSDNHPWSKIQHRLYFDKYSRLVKKFTKQCLPHLSKEKFDVVIPVNGYPQLKVLNEIRKQVGFKIIFSNQAQFHPSIWRMAGWDNWMKLRCHPDVFVALTEPMYEWALRYASPVTKVVKISNGVDLKKFHPGAKGIIPRTRGIIPPTIPLAPPMVLCVAGLEKYKRVELLIRALAAGVGATRWVALTNASLLILGDGPLKPQLENLGNRLLGPKRFRITTVSHEQMPAYYNSCDVFSLPSESLEAFGIAYLEAMACNKPVVAPDDPTRREIIGTAGVLTDVTNPQKYSRAIHTALNTKWRNRPRQQAKKISWDIVAEKYKKLLHSLTTDN